MLTQRLAKCRFAHHGRQDHHPDSAQGTPRSSGQIVKRNIALPNVLDKELRDFLERWNLSHPYDAQRQMEGS